MNFKNGRLMIDHLPRFLKICIAFLEKSCRVTSSMRVNQSKRSFHFKSLFVFPCVDFDWHYEVSDCTRG